MTVLEEAAKIIWGERRDTYGPAENSFERIARGWSVILGQELTAEQVALCMIWLKIARELVVPKRDNLVDICGYAALLEVIHNEKASMRAAIDERLDSDATCTR